MRTAIYGGSFNPPHLGHIAAAKTVMTDLRPDRLLIMPDCLAPHKAMAANTPSPEHRLEMCRLAFGDIPGAEISELEIRRGGKSYTVDTLEQLTALFPEDIFYLVMGSDMFLSFTTGWYRFEDILHMCIPVVISREEDDLEQLESGAEYMRSRYGADIRILRRNKPVVLSSSEVRETILAGGLHLLLSDPVREYIEKNGLYR